MGTTIQNGRPGLGGWTPEQTRLVKQTLLKPKNREATDDELLLFAYQCERSGLDPFTKQIYGIYRFNKRLGREELQTQAAIDGLRLIAERTGKYLGQAPVEWCAADKKWTDVWLESGPPFAARAGVYKQGLSQPTYAVARWSSYAVSGSPMWRDMPELMLGKCAEALALRKAFPAETSGLYIPEEMDQADHDEPLALPAPEPDEVVDPPITKTRAAQLVDRALTVGVSSGELSMQLIVFGVAHDEIRNKGTAKAAVEKCNIEQADQLERWISECADKLAAQGAK